MQNRTNSVQKVRTYPRALDGVKLTATASIKLGPDLYIPIGTDVTEIAREWTNLGALLACQMVSADPPVNWTDLQLPAHGEPEVSLQDQVPTELATEEDKPKRRRKGV